MAQLMKEKDDALAQEAKLTKAGNYFNSLF